MTDKIKKICKYCWSTDVEYINNRDTGYVLYCEKCEKWTRLPIHGNFTLIDIDNSHY